ncbi:hypothetical protein BLNAU_13378 [Blattamonas nauphoetae]|uniref:Uncharacterized protein n=1 Tax=Blattamonas nauphoetae TaxID=2049346 RepID=A0ABQ9XLC6_9EUKA|nr:hypothetical protein BLNAU_13378 [Blattamonas nauphoetae]
MSLIENLDELPTRCAITESCGLVSILSDIVSSPNSVGLKSIASGLLALIQNALGSRDIPTTEQRHLNFHQNLSMKSKQVNDVNEQLVELRKSMCNMATQIAEQFKTMHERQSRFDSLLSYLDEKRRSDFHHESRFQRWSKKRADAVELFDEDFIIKTGNTFTLRERPENEETNFVAKTLFSPIISSDVAQLSFTVNHSYHGYRYGAINPHLLDTYN